MEARTHLESSRRWIGEIVELEEGAARASLQTDEAMAVDERGLVHGGFVFSLADYAAMLAVNDPNVVLGGAEVRFTRPSKAGQRLEANARLVGEDGRKRIVEVEVTRHAAGEEGEAVLQGVFTCYVLKAHVFDLY